MFFLQDLRGGTGGERKRHDLINDHAGSCIEPIGDELLIETAAVLKSAPKTGQINRSRVIDICRMSVRRVLELPERRCG